MTKDFRKWTTINENGEKEEKYEDATWELVRARRNTMLDITDHLIGNQWDRLTEQQQTDLKAFRQTLRDAPEGHDNANDACDAMPEIPHWVVLLLG